MYRLVLITLATVSFLYGARLLTPEGSRGPAALPPVLVPAKDESSEFKDQIITELLNSTSAERRSQGVVLRLGTASKCRIFSLISITLIGEGIATSGEPPELHVESDCRDQILVPFEKIYGAAPQNGPILLEDDTLKVEAKNLEDGWPPEWYIGTIHLQNSDEPEASITIEAADFRKAKGRSVAIYW